MSGKKYLYVGELNYADEFDMPSIELIEEDDHEYLRVNSDFKFESLELYFGTNEGVEYDNVTVGELLREFTITEITDEQISMLDNMGIGVEDYGIGGRFISKLLESLHDEFEDWDNLELDEDDDEDYGDDNEPNAYYR